MANYGRIPQAELKFRDTSLVSTALLAPADVAGGEVNPDFVANAALNGVPQGVGDSQRVGLQYEPQSITIKGQITVAAQTNQTAADTAPEIFIALVMDRNANGAECRSEDVFVNKEAAGSLACELFPNLLFRHRFTILKVLKFRMAQPEISYDGTNLEQGGAHKSFSIYCDLKRFGKQRCKTTAETFASIETNALNLIAFCSSTSGAPKILYNARLRYYDQ